MYNRCFKCFFDLIFSLLLLLPFLFVFIIVAVAIKFEDGGTVIYSSKRLGKDGIIFNMYKFRSMSENAPDIRNQDGTTYNSTNDYRLTKVGRFLRKTSIDELPQLMNVIKGEMSFVGPRPDLPDQISIYCDDDIRKLECRPGITGYNQAYYRNSIDVKDRFKNDIYYIDHVSCVLDIKIIIATIFTIAKQKGVFSKV